MGTIDTLKDFYGDMVDDWKKAFDDLLDRDDDDDLPFGLPAQALTAMPGDTLRTMAVMSLLKDDDKKKNKDRNLAALALLSGNNPVGGAAAAAPALPGFPGAVGAPLGALGATGDAVRGLTALPQQIQQLSDLINLLLGALKSVEPLLGTAGGLGKPKQ